jgi:hypothetical protein
MAQSFNMTPSHQGFGTYTYECDKPFCYFCQYMKGTKIDRVVEAVDITIRSQVMHEHKMSSYQKRKERELSNMIGAYRIPGRNPTVKVN